MAQKVLVVTHDGKPDKRVEDVLRSPYLTNQFRGYEVIYANAYAMPEDLPDPEIEAVLLDCTPAMYFKDNKRAYEGKPVFRFRWWRNGEGFAGLRWESNSLRGIIRKENPLLFRANEE